MGDQDKRDIHEDVRFDACDAAIHDWVKLRVREMPRPDFSQAVVSYLDRTIRERELLMDAASADECDHALCEWVRAWHVGAATSFYPPSRVGVLYEQFCPSLAETGVARRLYRQAIHHLEESNRTHVIAKLERMNEAHQGLLKAHWSACQGDGANLIGPANEEFCHAFHTLSAFVSRVTKPAQVAAKPASELEQPSPSPPPTNASTEPRPFESGTMVFFDDRVELCGVVICSDKRSMWKRQILESLRQTGADGQFKAYSGERLRAATGVTRKDIASAIRDLRDGIAKALLKERAIHCEKTDVVVSGGHGYRLSQKLSVQDGTGSSDVVVNTKERNPRERDERDRHERDRHERDKREGRRNSASEPFVATAGNRQKWILDQIFAGRKLRIADVEVEWSVSNATARRDLGVLRKQGLIEFVGKPKTGHYRQLNLPQQAMISS